MKRYITILLVAISLCGSSVAQKIGHTIKGAKVEVQKFSYENDSVKLDLNYNLDDLKIGVNESMIFTPTLTKQDETMTLPTLVVKRRGSAVSYKRATTLGNQQAIDEYDEVFGEPYKVIEYYGSNKAKSAQYSVSFPYERWMVGSQLFLDCNTYGCCESENEGMLIPWDNELKIDIPVVDAFAFIPEVEFVKPEKVAVKRRDIQYSSALIFKVNSTVINPNLSNNQKELNSIDSMMQSVISDEDYTITKVNIIGFASPEGTLAGNMRLSKGRAAALETLMKRKYKMISPKLYNVQFGGENWIKLHEIVAQSDYPWKNDVLSIIDNYSIENGRESRLMNLQGGVPYKYLLHNVFPSTRLVVVDVEYNIDAYDLVRIGELIDTKPQNLSLEEMYRLSETYAIEDSEFEKIFMTAVQIYPNDEVAQNNALVTEIRKGDVSKVADLAQRADKETTSAEFANTLGVYFLMAGEYEKAEEMLAKAAELGSQKAARNQKLLETKLENLRQIKESNDFKRKIYGE